MESKGIKVLLVAILVAVIALNIPVWGMFLRGESADIANNSTAVNTASSTAATQNNGVSGSSATAAPGETENVFQPLPVEDVPGPNEWVVSPLILFKNPEKVQAETVNGKIASLTVKIAEGMEIRKPFDDSWFINVESEEGDPGFFFSKDRETAEQGIGVRIIAVDGEIEFLFKQDDGQLVNGCAIGICRYSGIAKITAYGVDVEAKDPAEWLNEVLKQATGSAGT